MNGWPSPTTMAWLTSGCARSRSSSTAGATFLPPAVTRISFLRPVIRTKPSSSTSPTSPVWNQPSALERLGGRLLVAPVAGEHLAAAEQQLAVVGDAHGGAGQRPADGADLVRVGQVDGQRGGGLGQAVALEHREPDAAVEVAEPVAERRAAGDGVRGTGRRAPRAACRRPAGRRPRAAPGPRRRARPVVEPARVGDRGLGGAVEDLAAPVGRGPLRGRVEDLLEHPRHREHERRAGRRRGRRPGS